MAGKEELTLLLEHVQKATGPSIWADLELLKLADPEHIAVQFWSDEYQTELRPGKFAHGFSAWNDSSSHSAPFPSYTASLDAITALIERQLPGRSIATMSHGETMPHAVIAATWIGQARTLPLALCAAFLHAQVQA